MLTQDVWDSRDVGDKQGHQLQPPTAPATRRSTGAPGMHRSCLLDPATLRLQPCTGEKKREIGIQREQHSVGKNWEL